MAKVSKERKQEIDDLTEVMATPAGRRLIWRVLEQAGIFAPCYTPEAEGARRVGLSLLGEIVSECPREYLMMQSEQMTQQTRKRIEKEATKQQEAEDDQD